MNKQLLFIQGGGEGGYEVDEKLVTSLKTHLAKGYDIHYPEIRSDPSLPDFGWTEQIGLCISKIKNEIIIVAHSLGASMLLKYLSEHSACQDIAGIFLIATPFWSGKEDWETGLKLKENFAENLPPQVPLYFYHSEDDEEIPIAHLYQYQQRLKSATFRILKSGGHQLNNGLTLMAKDIESL